MREAESWHQFGRELGACLFFSAGVWHSGGIRDEVWIHSYALSWPILFYWARNEEAMPTKPKASHGICFAELVSRLSSTLLPNNTAVLKSPQFESGKEDANSAAWQPQQKMIKWYWQELFSQCCRLTSRIRGCRKREWGPSQPVVSGGGLRWREPPRNSCPLSPSLEPPPSLLFLWNLFDMLVMSVGSCVFFHRAEWLGGPGPISCIILLCGRSHWVTARAFLPISAQGQASSAGWEITR